MHHMHDKSTRQHQILQYELFGSTPHSVTRHSHECLFSSGFLPDPKKMRCNSDLVSVFRLASWCFPFDDVNLSFDLINSTQVI